MSPPNDPPERILVVDDNHDAADTLALLLQFLDYDVRTAYDGQQAVDVAAEFRPHLVILDIHMPVMDGYEAAKQLRGRDGAQRTVLVALTAVATPEAQDKAKQAGFDIHLAKPVDGGELADLLHRVLH
jgi:CheY-like chemotaxis protein